MSTRTNRSGFRVAARGSSRRFTTPSSRAEWLDAARSGIEFLRRCGRSPEGKLYFSVTRDGRPLRMRRYVYSEAFAAIAHAAYAKAAGDSRAAEDAWAEITAYLRASFAPLGIPSKIDSRTRPSIGLGPLMMAIATAQEVRDNLGDLNALGRTCTEWIDWAVDRIERFFWKPEYDALLETVGPQGELIDHADGRMLNPGHALECAWFILHEARRRNESRYQRLALDVLNAMWRRGWDPEHGGVFYFRDVRGLPVQEYWHDMKFWWPHCEAIIATLLAWKLTGEEQYAARHRAVHDWSFRHFADPEFGEWFGYLHRDGRLSVPLKGSLWKGPFHLPRMLWYCWRLLESPTPDATR